MANLLHDDDAPEEGELLDIAKEGARLASQLYHALVDYEGAKEELAQARANVREYLARLNKAQLAFDAFVEKMKSDAPEESGWATNRDREDCTRPTVRPTPHFPSIFKGDD